MTEGEARKLAQEVAKATVRETLITLGIDADDPQRMQRNFMFLDSWRSSTEAVKRQGFITATVIIVTAFAGLIWLAIKGGPPTTPPTFTTGA